jgi:hypothetical protein
MIKTIIPLVALCCFHGPVGAQTATEKAKTRIDELLQPGKKLDSPLPRPLNLPSRSARKVEEPEMPLSVYKEAPPRLAPGRKPVLPRPATEGSPLAHYKELPTVPKSIELPTEPLAAAFAPDTNVPLELPILAKPQPDRASLGDQTLEASVAAALKPLSPARTQPVPFTPLNLPDPFENIQVGRLRNPPEESSQPPVIPVQTPRR